MATPSLRALRNVKVPVTDLAVALDWYGRVLGFHPTIEFRDHDGVLVGAHGELPALGEVLALRQDPAAALGLGSFAIANFEVERRDVLEDWVVHLDGLGVPHGPIVDAPRLSLLVFCNPDGQEIHLYTPIKPETA